MIINIHNDLWHKSAAVEAGAVAENQALKLSAVDDDIMIEFQAFSVISAVVPTTE